MHAPPIAWDDRRLLHISPDAPALVEHLVTKCLELISYHIETEGSCILVLSGGHTPLKLFTALSRPALREKADWSRVWLLWGDERAVPPDSPESNYGCAMRAGLDQLPIPKEQIHRMRAEEHLEQHAADYQDLIEHRLPKAHYDLLLLGVGEDGHTASLFPHSAALLEQRGLCVPNWIPDKECWRMTLTFPGLSRARNTWILASGAAKAEIVAEVLTDLDQRYPSGLIGSSTHPATWMLDKEAATCLPLALD